MLLYTLAIWYEKCFVKELSLRGKSFKQQLVIPLIYKGIDLEAQLRLDVLVEDILCVELKACDYILPIHEATIISYMKMLEKPKGIIINFNCVNIFSEGQKTYVNKLFSKLADD
nr:GxxExxY protein [Bacteroidota bacterium]